MFNSTFYSVATTKFKLPYVASIYGSHHVSVGRTALEHQAVTQCLGWVVGRFQ